MRYCLRWVVFSFSLRIKFERVTSTSLGTVSCPVQGGSKSQVCGWKRSV